MLATQCRHYFKCFITSISGDVESFASCKKALILPVLPQGFVHDLIIGVTEILKYEPTLLSLSSPISICGDLHGHLLDLFRILNLFGTPEFRKYLFLGDIVDRGEFSVETIILIYMMKVIWPKRVFIIRGNHEFKYMTDKCGFLAQLLTVYSYSIYNDFMTSFSFLPLAALIDSMALCLHGGLSPSLNSVSQIRNILKPFDSFGEDEMIDGILWSDPSDEIQYFTKSRRGSGFLYGADSSKEFLKENSLKYIFRGHECINEGLRIMFNCIVTVFSASNYCGIVKNDAALVNFKNDGIIEKHTLSKMDYLLRNMTTFRKEKVFVPVVIEPNSARIVAPRKFNSPISSAKGNTPRINVVNNHTKYNPSIFRRMRL